MCNEDVGAALGKAYGHDSPIEAERLARAGNIVRRDMFKIRQRLSCSFDVLSQENSVPASLLALLTMILYGRNITEQYGSSQLPQ